MKLISLLARRRPLQLAFALLTWPPLLWAKDAPAVLTNAPAAPWPPGISTFPALSDFPGAGPVRTQDWFRTLWIQRRSEWARDRERDQGAVVFLGDSITQGWGSLAKDFPDLKVANRGLSGDTTRGVRYRLQDDVIALHPRAVVLLIGTNDLEDGADPELVAVNVKAILAALRASDPKLPLIVCRVMPSDASKQRPADKIQQINRLVDALVAAEPLGVECDTWGVFADADGNAQLTEFPDLLHPNPAGYAKWAAALRPLIAKLPLAH